MKAWHPATTTSASCCIKPATPRGRGRRTRPRSRSGSVWSRRTPPSLTTNATWQNSHNNLGTLLRDTGDPEGAREAHQAAIAIGERLVAQNPTVSDYQSGLAIDHHSLGVLLRETGDPEGAREAFQAAIAIGERLVAQNPTVSDYQNSLAASHLNLGVLLRETGDPEGAREAHQAAIAIQERLLAQNPSVSDYQSSLAASHLNLGALLSVTGDPEGAREAYQAAIAIVERLVAQNPSVPELQNNLGGALNNIAMLDLDDRRFAEARDCLREAISWQKKALATNPANPTYRQFLGNHYRNLRKAAQGLGDPDLLAEAQQGLTELQASDPRFQALDARLAEVLGGNAPSGNAERLALALHAYNSQRFAAAARLFGEALDNDPSLTESRQTQHPYNASCAAALAAAGQGIDDPQADNEAKARLRAQALAWLQFELATWTQLVESANDKQRNAIAQTLAHWQQDPDLASLRGDAIDSLPESERPAWKQLWSDVAALLARAGEASPADTETIPD